MPYKEKFPQRIYFEIGEVAKSVGEAPSAIRFWLAEFDINISKRSKTGKRKFTVDEWRQVRAISYLLKTEEYTINGALKKFQLWKKGLYEIPYEWIYLTLPTTGEEPDNNIHTDNHQSNS